MLYLNCEVNEVLNNKWLAGAIVFLSLAILFSGLWVGNSLKTSGTGNNNGAVQMEISADILTFEEAAVYLRIDEQDLLGLLENSQYVDGQGIPYYKIDGTVMFSKTALTDWLSQIARSRIEY